MYASSSEQQRRAQVQALAGQIYDAHRSRLLAIAKRNCDSGGQAEDALQDAFISFIEHFDPASEAPPLAWLTLTLKRRSWALYRAQHLDRRASQKAASEGVESRFSVTDIPAETPGAEETIERAEFVLEAREKLACLKPAERRALGLIAAGYSYREIGQMSGWTYTKTNRCAAEGRASLRRGQRVE